MLLEQRVGNDGIKALAVVVDHPPAIAKVVLPALQQAFEDVALVELGIAEQCDHAAFRPVLHPAMGADIILGEAGEGRHRHAEADGAGGQVDVVGVLGARGIGLRAAETAEGFQLVAGLVAEQILDRVEGGARVRLHRDTVLRPQHPEEQRRHHGRQRRGGRLMPADLQAVDVLADVIGVVDDPRRQPKYLALEHLQFGDVECCRRLAGSRSGVASCCHGASPVLVAAIVSRSDTVPRIS